MEVDDLDLVKEISKKLENVEEKRNLISAEEKESGDIGLSIYWEYLS